jgi:endonuclease/exonuclease/phosphatase (EEP) superfamily protein YafD
MRANIGAAGRKTDNVLTFLFWNTNRKPLFDLVAHLVEEHQVDVVMLAESAARPVEVLQKLNENSPDFHYAPPRAPTAVEVFTRFSGEFLRPTFESGRVSIHRMALPARAELLLVMAHLPSKLHWSEDSQALECAELARSIRQEEEKVGHSRTLLIGDLNVDPFESGVVSAAGLHGLMTRELAAGKNLRTVQGKDYATFYNPMWGHFGDRTGGPSGSYYYERAEHKVHFWHLFDQILIRPDVLEFCSSDPVSIVTRAGDIPLLSKSGSPDHTVGSDHLPLLFKLSV